MAGIPQVITEDRASGAQFIDGSLKFDSGKGQYLKRKPTADGNRKLWTWSGWLKRTPGSLHDIFSAGQENTNDGLYSRFRIDSDDYLNYRQWVNTSSLDAYLVSSMRLRDPSAYFHYVAIYDSSNSTNSDKVRFYINGQRVTVFSSNDYPGGTNSSWVNSSSKTHTIGGHYDGGGSNADSFWNGHMSQVYFLDGIAAGPEEFGYTDPLTNTWRPKKFKHLSTSISTQYSGASVLTWDNNPIGSVYTLSNGNRTATASGGSGYTGADVWSNAIPADSTTAWTLEITNSDSVGGWYFADSQTPSGTHPDERGGNSMGLRNQDADAAFRGTFATANGYSNSGNQLSLPGCETFGSRRVDFVVYRPASGTGKVWVKDNGASTWVGGGNPSDTSSTPSFVIPDGNTYFGYTFYDRSSGDQVATFDGDGSIQQKIGANSFYLPLDGNTPIGQDQSGKGNNWTPVNFGGSVDLPKATGAIPILNTNDAGTVAKGGVRTDSKTYTVTASGGNYYLDGALKPTLNAYRGGSYTFDYTGATSHPFYLSSLQDGKWNSKAYSVQFDGSGDYLSVPSSSDFDFGSGDCTVECFVYITSHAGDKTIIGSWEGTTSWQLSYGADSGNDRFAFMMHDGSSTLAAISSFQSTNYVNQWVHLAGVRHGNWLKVYVNGIFGGERSISGAHTTFNAPLTIGGRSNGNQVTGYVSNVRVVKGTALYTAAFTPPSTTLTNVTGTTLLCCQENDAATAAVIPSGSITVSGNAATSQSRHPFLYDNNHTDFGLNLSTSNTTKITIPHTAADTLYYYCNAHSGMGSSINVTTDIFKADPYAWKCMFAMASDTIDHSPEINVNSTATSFGDIHTSNLQKLRNLYGHSKKMETGGGFRIDMELTTAEANAKHKFDTNDFTLECWYYQDGGNTSWQSLFRSASYNNYTSLNSDGIAFYANGQTLWPYSIVSGSGQPFTQTAVCVPYKKWNHAAWTRQGGVNRIFANGVLVVTFNNSNSWNNKGWEIGDVYTWNGGYQDARIYNGVAKYTESFVVPATEPDVLPDTPSGITGKTNLAKITEGAVSFDGSGDYLTIPWSTDFELGTGDFTIEYYGYWNSNGTSIAWGSDINNRFDLGCISTGSVRFFCRSSSSTFINISADIARQKWTHIAAVREGTAFRLYVDGKLEASGTASDTMPNDSSNTLDIGRRRYASTGSEPTDGFISNVRIVKGTALYTSNFTPPAAPLTNVTNTKLLCCQSNTSANASAVSPNISGVNNGTVWSSYFTGNHDSTHGWGTLYKASNAFDGNLNSMAIGQVDAEGLTWTAPGGGIGADATTIRIYGNDDNCPDDYLKINGINYGGLITQGFGPDWTVLKGTGAVGAGITQLESVYLRDNSAGNQHYRWRALEIDGTVIVDPVAANGDAKATNFNPFTDDINTIRGQASGYATLNPLNVTGDLSENNLSFYRVAKGGTTSTIGVESGKIYVEAKGDVGNGGFGFGFVQSNYNNNGTTDIGDATNSFGIRAVYNNITFKIQGGTNTSINADSTLDTIFAYAVDFDTGLVNLLRDGVIIHSETLSLDSGTYYVAVASETSSATKNVHVNFGQKPFKFPPPDGFQPLNLSNAQPEKVFARPDQYIGVTLYTGSGAGVSPRTIELPQEADLVWAKSRDRTSAHQIADTVRGDNSVLRSNTNSSAQSPTTQFNGGGISTIDGKIISLVKGSTNQANNENLNATGQRGAVWSWKAGGSKGTFNVDDVGYANASDVNMNVGAFDSSTFLTGQVWSGLMSASGGFDQAASRAFDGFLRTDPNRLRTSGNQVLVTMNLSSAPVTVSSQIKVYAEPGYNSSCTVTVGGVTHTSSTGALHTFNVSGSLTQMTLQSTQSGGRTYMEGMEIDGKLLVDNNITVNAPSVDNTGCSVGTKQGFSIVAYNATGSDLRVSHGLSERPGFIILKSKNVSGDWLVWHQNLDGVDRFMKLNETQAQAQADNVFLSVDSNTFGTGNDSGINSSNQQKISYIWHDVSGLQKFGKYEGTATADGPFIPCEFKPALVLIKSIDVATSWYLFDDVRGSIQTLGSDAKVLFPDTSATEDANAGQGIDFLSNGFKVRAANGYGINNAATYIYCAWAEAPTVNLYGGHANAR